MHSPKFRKILLRVFETLLVIIVVSFIVLVIYRIVRLVEWLNSPDAKQDADSIRILSYLLISTIGLLRNQVSDALLGFICAIWLAAQAAVIALYSRLGSFGNRSYYWFTVWMVAAMVAPVVLLSIPESVSDIFRDPNTGSLVRSSLGCGSWLSPTVNLTFQPYCQRQYNFFSGLAGWIIIMSVIIPLMNAYGHLKDKAKISAE